MVNEHQEEYKYKQSIYLLLLIFLGFTGAHKFYSKNYKKAKVMLSLFLVVTLSLLIAFLDGLINLKQLAESKPPSTISICLVLLSSIAYYLLCFIYFFDLSKALIFNPIKFYTYEPIAKLLSKINIGNDTIIHNYKKMDYLKYLLLGGMIGLHHFYAKNTKIARLYLGLFMFAGLMFIIHYIAGYYEAPKWVPDPTCIDCHQIAPAGPALARALRGPFGALLCILPMFIILCGCFVDFLIVISKKSDKDGYITF